MAQIRNESYVNHYQTCNSEGKLQEAQLPQRNSASAAHMEGAKPSSPLPSPSG